MRHMLKQEKYFASPKISEMGKSVEIFINPSPSEIRQIPTMQDEYKFARFIINDKHDVFVFDGDAMHEWLSEFIPSRIIAEGTIDYAEHVVDGYGAKGVLEVKSNVWFQLYYKGWELPRGRGFIESKLTELFDKPVSWTIKKETDEQFQANFDIGENVYDFMCSWDYQQQNWEIEFSLDKIAGETVYGFDKSFGISGTGEQFTIFATVADLLFYFIRKYAPEKFFFTASEASRIKLYNHFSKALTMKVPYDVDIVSDSKIGRSTYYRFTRK